MGKFVARRDALYDVQLETLEKSVNAITDATTRKSRSFSFKSPLGNGQSVALATLQKNTGYGLLVERARAYLDTEVDKHVSRCALAAMPKFVPDLVGLRLKL